nr:hypothetical protein [Tanacetum cinerariifolium]
MDVSYYKVSVDKSLVDAACISDVGNNGFKTVKDAVGSFFAWLKNQVVLDPKVKERSRKGQNRIKTGQKREAWRRQEMPEAVTVDRARKTEENKKRMSENANTSRKLLRFKEEKKREGPNLQYCQSIKFRDPNCQQFQRCTNKDVPCNDDIRV